MPFVSSLRHVETLGKIKLMDIRKIFCLLAALAFLGGCAAMDDPQVETSSTLAKNRAVDEDPLKSFNDAVFTFNRHFDGAVLKPIAKSYKALVPKGVRDGISNFFLNLHDLPSAVNSLLQGRAGDAAVDLGRLGVNSTIGVGGLVDQASDLGLESHKSDFGQTLAVWGIPSGPYLVLPLFGPGSVRSHLGTFVDFLIYPVGFLHDPRTETALLATETVSRRSGALSATKLIESTGVSGGYETVKSAYLQYRRAKIWGGNGMDDGVFDDLYDQ